MYFEFLLELPTSKIREYQKYLQRIYHKIKEINSIAVIVHCRKHYKF
jgi:hypothetical protein